MRALSLILAMTMASCATLGKDFSSQLDWLEKDVTTQKDVVMVLGKPYAVGSATGSPTWTYGYYTYNLFGDSYFKELKFFWTKSQRVKQYSFISSFPEELASMRQ